MAPTWRRPAFLAPRDRIAVVAPAGIVPRSELLAGLAWLRLRYDVVWSPHALDRRGYLAGSDEARGGAFRRAWNEGSIKAVFAARGGYGAMRLLEEWELDLGERSPWLVGFSDITALHAACQSAAICSLHAPNVTGLGVAHPVDRRRLIACLEGEGAPHAWGGLTALTCGGVLVEGRAVGGNLALIHAMAAAGRFPVFEDAVVFLEDVTEKPYRVDRMLTSLRLGGVFAKARAIVCGSFTQCEPGPDGTEVREVVLDVLGSLGVPILWDAPFGHGARNAPFVLGAPVRIVGDRVEF